VKDDSALVHDTWRQEESAVHQVHLQTCNKIILPDRWFRLALRSSQGRWPRRSERPIPSPTTYPTPSRPPCESSSGSGGAIPAGSQNTPIHSHSCVPDSQRVALRLPKSSNICAIYKHSSVSFLLGGLQLLQGFSPLLVVRK
jgi:hypothetical protein